MGIWIADLYKSCKNDDYGIIAGSLESANSSILTAQRFFKEVVGKNQDFMLIRLLNTRI